MAFGRKEEQIHDLEREVATLSGEKNELLGRLATEQVVGPLAESVRAALADARQQPGIVSDAEALAFVSVVAQERERLTAELSDQMVRNQYDRFAVRFRTEQGAKIKGQLTELFEADGTFDRIQEQAEQDVCAEIQAGILADKKAEATEELSTDEQIQAYKDEILEGIKGSDEIARFREETAEQLQSNWRTEVVAEVNAEVKSEEAAKETEFKKQYRQELLQSRGTLHQREQVRAILEREWREATTEQVAAAVKDEELTDLLKTRADQERDKLAKEVRAHELLQGFNNYGINLQTMPKDTRLAIYLGEYRKVTANLPDDRGYTREQVVDGVVCARLIDLVSVGDGNFVVDADSLHGSPSVYERKNAIPVGTVIIPGRKVQIKKEHKIQPFLASDVPMFYDDDSTTADIVDTGLPVANVKVDGVWARPTKAVQMPNNA